MLSAQHGTRLGRPATISRRTSLTVKAISTPATPGGRPSSSDGKKPSIAGSRAFFDKDGNRIKPMPTDFGFRSGVARLYEDHDGEVPKGFWELAGTSLEGELGQIRAAYRFASHFKEFEIKPAAAPGSAVDKVMTAIDNYWTNALASMDKRMEDAGMLPKLEAPTPLTNAQLQEFKMIKSKLAQLRLDDKGVMRREAEREASSGALHTPTWVRLPFQGLSWALDRIYEKKPIAKFWVLETVARIPYMSYVSVLHLYESLGFWRAGAELRKVHFAEEYNELHHLQIMESLGGDQAWFDRFFAEHAAMVYYWVLLFMYLGSPKVAYNFAQLVEHHASDTYTEFLESNREVLSTIPPPQVALAYYRGSADLYMFAEKKTDQERPDCNNLLDVFINIRNDENEHVKTMAACQTDDALRQIGDNRK